MQMRCQNRTRVISIFVIGMLFTVPTLAYVDPNSTGLITQILGPVLIIAAAGLTFLRKQAGRAFGRLVGVFRLKKK